MLIGPIPLDQVPAQPDLTGLAIGVFDGVHLGHQAVIGSLGHLPRPIAAITFEPHPMTVVAPDRAPRRLTTLSQKYRLLEQFGASRVIAIAFNSALKNSTAHVFFQQLLRMAPNVRQISVGAQWAFGLNRQGSVEQLQEWSSPLGIQIHATPPVVELGAIVSSTRIRESIGQNDLATANRLLGWSYAISGKIMHGQARGRTIGFPTANLSEIPQLVPPMGTYAVRVRLTLNGVTSTYIGVLNHGLRPTVSAANMPSVEVHLLDFSGNLYDQELLIDQFHFLRPEQRFSSVELLSAQIQKDVAEARVLIRDM